MKVSKGKKRIKNKTMTSIVDIQCNNNYEIFVFQGSLSKYDIIIKYSENGKRTRTPKHIHWVVDILMKMQSEKELTKLFLSEIKKMWDKTLPLNDNSYDTLVEIFEDKKTNTQITRYSDLNKHGEYDVDFLMILMELLMIQEKTNREDAYMFGNIIDKLLEDELDIFSIMSVAGFNGR